MSESGPETGGEAAALRALQRHRERAGRQGSGEECLIERAADAADAVRHRRREEAVGWAVEELGLAEWIAGEVYDIAREEGVEPALALELIHCGVSVLDPVDLDMEDDAPTTDAGSPDWIEAAPPEESARRERRLRSSLRRLRRLLERHEDPASALVAFAREPDVGDAGY